MTTLILRPLLALVVLIGLGGSLIGGETLSEDQWYVGELNGTPAISLHVSTWKQDDGGLRTRGDMILVIQRTIGGRTTPLMRMAQSQDFWEDASGAITRFNFDEDQNGIRTSANGQVIVSATGSSIRGHVVRNGTTTPVLLPLEPDDKLLGDQTAWRSIAADPANAKTFASVALISAQLVTMKSTVRVSATTPLIRAVITPDRMSIPMEVDLTADGRLMRMAMNIGIARITLTPCAQAPVIGAGNIDLNAMLVQVGPGPKPAPHNTLILPAQAAISSDEFQTVVGDRITLHASSTAAAPSPELRATLLAPTPMLEINEPALRTWALAGTTAFAAQSAELAEDLRLRVRTHITIKDLSQGDATAVETFRSKRGDCTEHSNLLCAALRIAGIPARVEVGAVYVPTMGGWVGHAWVSAYAGGAWRSLDAAYPGLPRSLYIKMGSGEDAVNGAMMKAMVSVGGKQIRMAPSP